MLPLTGVTVVDLSRLLPGPLCTMFLRDMGARVIKVEDTEGGDYLRHLGMPGGQVNPVFDILNANKESISLDLAQSQGRQLLKQLLQHADVLLESFRPGVMQRLGLDYSSLTNINPQLVMCSLSGYGQTGPWAQLAGHDMNYCATAGVLDQCGRKDSEPALANFQMADIAGGAQSAAMAILAALFARLQRQHNGQPATGEYLDISMTDCLFNAHIIPLSMCNLTGDSAARGDDMLTGQCPNYDVYATRDGRYMAMAALEKKFWQRFCQVIDQPSWVERYGQTGQAAQILRDDLRQLFASETQQYWAQKLLSADCCVTPILSVRDAFEQPQLMARDMLHTLTNAQGQTWRCAAPAWSFSGQRFCPSGGGPAQGQHSQSILQQLGHGADVVNQWAEQKIIRITQ